MPLGIFDSSAAAALLHEAGHEVVGVTLKLPLDKLDPFLDARLLPEEIAAVLAVIDRRTKEGKETYAAFQSSLKPGMTVVSAEESAECHLIASHAKLALQRMGVTFDQTEFMFTTDYNGVQLKCAIDGVAGDYLWDLKSTDDCSPAALLRSIKQYRYNLQAYFYRLCYETAFGQRMLGFRFLFIEKQPPYATAVVEIGPELMSYAVADFEKALQTYRECTTLNDWPAYGDDIQVIDIKAATTSTPITFA